VVQGILTPVVIVPSVAGVVGLILGWLLSRRGSATPQPRIVQRAPADTDAELRGLRRNLQLVQNEYSELSQFLTTLPDLARELNSNKERQDIWQIIISSIERLFKAEQIHIFKTSGDGQSLVLFDAKGIAPEQRRLVAAFGKGRIGWVAQQQIAMDESDFKTRTPNLKGALDEQADPRLRSDLCAPVVAGNHTRGVISLGGLMRRPKEEKKILRMVADLLGLAIQNRELVARIQDIAHRDGLTGLNNKRYFTTHLADMLLRSQKEQSQLSLFIFDIDHFKKYNDSNGHVAGDECLKLTGRLIRSNVRKEDLAARYGGEEFVVLLPNTDKATALKLAEKIRRCVETSPFPEEHKQPGGKVTISGGVATCPEDAQDSAGLIRCADEALYEGKKKGRNRVFAYRATYLTGEQEGQEGRAPMEPRSVADAMGPGGDDAQNR
jgi:diguanylate cyclase (GGDEF)-like protein